MGIEYDPRCPGRLMPEPLGRMFFATRADQMSETDWGLIADDLAYYMSTLIRDRDPLICGKTDHRGAHWLAPETDGKSCDECKGGIPMATLEQVAAVLRRAFPESCRIGVYDEVAVSVLRAAKGD